MKIKCVDNYGCGYLTVGKIYDIKFCDEDNVAGDIIDDEGDVIFEFLLSPSHAKWEAVK